jgi:imidazole glycerol-phosphate synthase subunit HisH
MSIAVINYGVGNVRSIVNAFENQGAKILLTRDKNQILNSDGIVLPGVGAFSYGMESLNRHDLVSIIEEFAKLNKPILGICLGMQMLFEESEEFGVTSGLGLIPGKVVKLLTNDSDIEKIPHVSWNELSKVKQNWSGTILDEIKEGSDMYFVHSFIVQPENKTSILSVTEYSGHIFCSSVKRGKIYGCQFHPEKSGNIGLKVINNFIRICNNE